jgi:hypothetical protein
VPHPPHWLFALALLLAATAAGAQDGPYLFELLKKPDYLRSYRSILHGAEQREVWLTSARGTPDGPSTPSRTIVLSGKRYTLASVCKAHECDEYRLFLLFSENGKQAWGLLRRGDDQTFLGAPDAEKRQALAQQD